MGAASCAASAAGVGCPKKKVGPDPMGGDFVLVGYRCAVACSGATGSASGPQRAHGACHTCCCHRRKGPRQVLQPQEGQRRDGRKARQRASLGWYQCQRRGLPLAVGSHDPESDPVQGGPAGPAGRHPPRKGLPGTDPALFPLGQRSSGAYQWLGHACAMPWAQGRGTLQT